jgi:L-threonylcarbamoyladenylate synthase
MMETRILALTDPAALDLACALLAGEQVVAAPTDTVYGVFARPDSPLALERIYIAKARPPEKAIPVLISNDDQLAVLVRSPLPTIAIALMRRFWPGALTLILPALPHLPAILTAGQPTVAVRMPDHDGLRQLLRRTGPLAATSANLSGDAETHTADEVAAQLGGRIPLILAGAPRPPGPPSPASTIVDCSGPTPTIVREGALAPAVRRLLAEAASHADRD